MKRITVELGGKTRQLRFGSMAAQNAVDEIQRSGGFQIIPGQRLQIADAANVMVKTGDSGITQAFLRNGLLNPNTNLPDKNLTPETVYGWIDEHIHPEKGGGDMTAFTIPIVHALIAAGLVKAEAVQAPISDEARPTLTAVKPEPAGE